ncbi:tryptophan synthase subunit alpha [Mumia sp. zg.B53]|uniref:tryptophan synthase subunit alpha n=1 Tax=unclassified Mumia TaxID=2621872 RepID=UPI001C6EA358|nr:MULTISPECIES: tryptophan synthase subunit alpha [unclassified Mumia]MBW9206199.1 tryptophan synthase subunit alpha [Mumia sp. zg.B17]MBW9211507.1 tryptophan synthase subunit alpha [Mumia sp. zg.B21]MBW9216680.1 tryptophan synthase subunit alpha [Mumia sp. zg.B53]MDD9348283.1 tryptophan synthase subunit alpha [Mumia sp.]
MSRLDEVLAKTRAEGRPALVGYLPAGFPDKQTAIEAMVAMVDAGVDIVEIGLPYSDPVMDGPTIQKAADAALRAGTRIADVFDTVEAVAATGAPTLVMTYWNPVERIGVDTFASRLAAAGGAGLITPDLIPDEAGEWVAAASAHGLDRVFLVAPSSTDERIAMTGAASSGFLYATSVMGVTGARTATSTAAPALVERVRRLTDIPIGVGLGVSNGDQAADVGRFADAVIVGSALVACLLQAGSDRPAGVAAVRSLAQDLRAGVERARADVHSPEEGAPA